MMGLLVDDKIIVRGPIVNLPAPGGAAIAAVVFTVPLGLVGVKSVKIYRVNIYNNAPAGNTQVLVGNGVGGAFAPLLPALDTFNGLNDAYGPETALIQAESFANVTAYAAVIAVGGSIDIQLEVEIRG
jgi:hypothetical protein